MRRFENFHPIVLFIYFFCVILFAMFTMNPVLVAICYISGIFFCGMLTGIKKLLQSLAYSIPVMLLIAVTNPIFVHKGETILFFLNDNPVTMEAIIYGAVVSAMLMSVFYWFKCYNAVMTSDKFVYLFGRIIPKLSLVLSMVLGFIPKFKRHFREIDQAQKALGIYASKSYVDKIRIKFRVLSILITLSLENSVETADSIRARGYGLKGRSSYSVFKWTVSDTVFLTAALFAAGIVLALVAAGFSGFYYYPVMSVPGFRVADVILYSALAVLTFAAAILEIKENILWRYLRSKI